MTTTIYNTYINAPLADATYVHGLRSGSDLKDDLEKRMTPILADYISKNFSTTKGVSIALFSQAKPHIEKCPVVHAFS